MRFACRITEAIIQTHIHNNEFLFLFHGNTGYANAPQCYVISTLPVLMHCHYMRFSVPGVKLKRLLWAKKPFPIDKDSSLSAKRNSATVKVKGIVSHIKQ